MYKCSPFPIIRLNFFSNNRFEILIFLVILIFFIIQSTMHCFHADFTAVMLMIKILVFYCLKTERIRSILDKVLHPLAKRKFAASFSFSNFC